LGKEGQIHRHSITIDEGREYSESGLSFLSVTKNVTFGDPQIACAENSSSYPLSNAYNASCLNSSHLRNFTAVTHFSTNNTKDFNLTIKRTSYSQLGIDAYI